MPIGISVEVVVTKTIFIDCLDGDATWRFVVKDGQVNNVGRKNAMSDSWAAPNICPVVEFLLGHPEVVDEIKQAIHASLKQEVDNAKKVKDGKEKLH